MKIESINNLKVKEWMKLKEKKYRDLRNEFLIEGDHLLELAKIHGKIKAIIALDDSWEVPGIPFYQVTEAILKKISSQVSISPVMAIVEKLEQKEVAGNVCILDHIQDPGNLGTIIRSAVAFQFETILMSPDTVDLYNEKTIRATEGMLFSLNYIKGDLRKEIDKLKKLGYTIYGTDVVKGTSLNDIPFSKKNAVIIGNEGQGMSITLKEKCDYLINIPIASSCESLNAGVSASIIFYEISKK